VPRNLSQFFMGGALLAIAPFFFLGGPDWVSLPLYRSLWDAGHVVFFALLARFLQSRCCLASPWRWLWLSLAVAVLGSAIEFAQQWAARDPSFMDVWRDLLGLWLGLFWGLAPSKRVYWMRALASVLALPTLALILQAGAAQLNALRNFPLLAGFETPLELLPMDGDLGLSEEFFTQGRQSIKVQLNGEQYSGVGINSLQRDWRGYEFLVMDIYLPGRDSLVLTLRIADLQHDRGTNAYEDRFNLRITLHQGWNSLRVALVDIRSAPKARAMNMAEISHLRLFAQQLPQQRYFYWDNLRLE
jgi:hypothetical protein